MKKDLLITSEIDNELIPIFTLHFNDFLTGASRDILKWLKKNQTNNLSKKDIYELLELMIANQSIAEQKYKTALNQKRRESYETLDFMLQKAITLLSLMPYAFDINTIAILV